MKLRSRSPSSHTKSVPGVPHRYVGWHGLLPAALALSRALEREMDRALSVVPLSACGFVVLLTIEREAPLTQGTLARTLSVGAATLSEQLRRLERSGLLRRNPARRGGAPRGGAHSASGADQPEATLTDRGAAVLSAAEEIAVRVERAWARRLAAAGNDPQSVGRAVGLRRWLTESRAALADGAGASGH